MSEIDRARCRRAAAECIDLARTTTDPETKQVLLTRAQEWLKLAYSEHDAELDHLLTEFNSQQMSPGKKVKPRVPRRPMRLPMQQQEVQQQQSKAEPEDKNSR
jgi:hypothetical protein